MVPIPPSWIAGEKCLITALVLCTKTITIGGWIVTSWIEKKNVNKKRFQNSLTFISFASDPDKPILHMLHQNSLFDMHQANSCTCAWP